MVVLMLFPLFPSNSIFHLSLFHLSLPLLFTMVTSHNFPFLSPFVSSTGSQASLGAAEYLFNQVAHQRQVAAEEAKRAGEEGDEVEGDEGRAGGQRGLMGFNGFTRLSAAGVLFVKDPCAAWEALWMGSEKRSEENKENKGSEGHEGGEGGEGEEGEEGGEGGKGEEGEEGGEGGEGFGANNPGAAAACAAMGRLQVRYIIY